MYLHIHWHENIPNKADYLYAHLWIYAQRTIQKSAHHKVEDFYLWVVRFLGGDFAFSFISISY